MRLGATFSGPSRRRGCKVPTFLAQVEVDGARCRCDRCVMKMGPDRKPEAYDCVANVLGRKFELQNVLVSACRCECHFE